MSDAPPDVTFDNPEVLHLSARGDHRFDLGKLRRMFASLKDDVNKTREFLPDIHEDQEALENMVDYFTKVQNRIAKFYRARPDLVLPDEISKERAQHGKNKSGGATK